MFRIEDERHSEFHGDFETMAAAVEELRRRAEIPWDQEPNRAPCTNWRTCGRSYEIIEFESNPYRETHRIPALEVSAEGVRWIDVRP